jgi:hypothetical protein
MPVDSDDLMTMMAQSMKQMRESSRQKMRRLREIEGEAESLRHEIEMLDSSANQLETTMRSLFFDKGAAANNRRAVASELQRSNAYADDYDDADFDQHDLADLLSKFANKQAASQNHYQQPQRSVLPMRPVNNHGGNKHFIPPIDPNIEIKSQRFSDRTITQACTILMREAGRPLHVNELYNRLLENGFIFTGNNPTISIAVSLNRNRRFRKVSPGTFDLVMRDASSQAAS